MINLNHTIEEVNIILNHLARGAYGDVHILIEKIKNQANPQVDAIIKSTPPTESPRE
jgi:hypothetical protein